MNERTPVILLGFDATEIGLIETQLDRMLRSHPGYRALLKIQGLGPVLAGIFVAEIGDITRFPTASSLACWAGLTPRVHASDLTVHHGHISRQGSTLVRWAAVEAVQRKCEPCVREVRDQIITRRGRSARNIAKVAAEADVFRFDASDLMPKEVGSGTFWTEMVEWISGKSSKDTLKAIEDSWPAS